MHRASLGSMPSLS
jgi:hypothetical protein